MSYARSNQKNFIRCVVSHRSIVAVHKQCCQCAVCYMCVSLLDHWFLFHFSLLIKLLLLLQIIE